MPNCGKPGKLEDDDAGVMVDTDHDDDDSNDDGDGDGKDDDSVMVGRLAGRAC